MGCLVQKVVLVWLAQMDPLVTCLGLNQGPKENLAHLAYQEIMAFLEILAFLEHQVSSKHLLVGFKTPTENLLKFNKSAHGSFLDGKLSHVWEFEFKEGR